jgi:predicted HicB family RNase H-like nuclease
MNDTLTYRGYIGSVHYSADDNVFFGKVEGINDLITFEGGTVQELKDAFHYAVDEHVKDCTREGIAVEKSYGGSFNVRITPNLHRRAALAAKMHGTTLNAFVKEAIEKRLAVGTERAG